MAAVMFDEPEGITVKPRIRGFALAGPEILPSELANVCWKKCRRSPDRASDLLAALAQYPAFKVAAHPTDYTACVQLALATGLTAYDASHLWLARHRGAELVTLDQQLQRAALANPPLAKPP